MTDRASPPTATANRVERASAKKRRKPLALFVVPVVLVLLGAGVLLFLGGGTDAIPIIGDGPDESVPPFDFKVKKAVAISTVAEFDKDAIGAQAESVGAEITPTIDDLFTNAFLDPTNWREGDYEEVFEAFAPISVASAQDGVEAITLGTTAGDVFAKVEPDKGSLEYRVLFDPEGNAESAVVRYRFYATAERKDGSFLGVFSHGQLYLSNVDGWKITAFDVIRGDSEVEPPAATGASGTSGGTGATSTTGGTVGSGTTGASGATGTS